MKKFVRNMSKKKRLLIIVSIGLILVVITTILSDKFIKNDIAVVEPEISKKEDNKTEEIKNEEPRIEEGTNQEEVPEEPAPTWPVIYSLEQANSVTVVVNKKHKLPSNYVPSLTSVSGGQLRPEAAEALNNLLADAQNAGAPISVISSYRSYSTQASTYQRWVNRDGQALADTYSARPGHSEHQTGLAVDLGVPNGSCSLETCFGDTAQGIWLEENAHKYGFIIRYTEGKQSITGYQYEPWHLRYVGTQVATAIKNSGLTMDQYYGVPAGDY
jgi:D-alanyl-D-alanine carboxypeptidase